MATPETRGIETATALRKTLRWLVIATVVLYLFLIGIGIKIWRDGQATNDALCTFRANLQQQVDGSLQYLKDHPNGTPGISPKDILDSIARQQVAINSLDSLNCSDAQTPPTPTPSPTARKK